jgi:cytochrome c553
MRADVVAWIAGIALLGAPPFRLAQDTGAARIASEVCASCHGPRGASVSPAFPQLAGQQAAYLEAQLKAFRNRSRADPMAQAFMWGMASQLSDDAIAGLAAYYSAQRPPAGNGGNAALLKAGQAIFRQGVPAAGIAACQTCHGQAAEGAATVPRLAGQHAEYLLKQLVLFKTELRAGASAPIMHVVSTGLSFEQMQAAAAYLASLGSR